MNRLTRNTIGILTLLATLTCYASDCREKRELKAWRVLRHLPRYERRMLFQVAKEYELSVDETKLLMVIRKIENGRQGREMGVLHPSAQRYADDPDCTKSLRLQAQWAAGTIAKRYHGDLEAFAARWAPIGADNDPDNLNRHWLPNAQRWMKE